MSEFLNKLIIRAVESNDVHQTKGTFQFENKSKSLLLLECEKKNFQNIIPQQYNYFVPGLYEWDDIHIVFRKVVQVISLPVINYSFEDLLIIKGSLNKTGNMPKNYCKSLSAVSVSNNLTKLKLFSHIKMSTTLSVN